MPLIIDDFSRPDGVTTLGTHWRGFSDRVMSGVSVATVGLEAVDGRRCARLTGDVRLDNNGGFVQMAVDLAPDLAGVGNTLDGSRYAGVALLVRGNGETYGCHLRTPDALRPWQSYRASFTAPCAWHEVVLAFASFLPHRLSVPLDTRRLRRLGLVAIGRAFHADLAVARIALIE